MSLALTAQKVIRGLRTKERFIKAVASGNYSTGGDTVNLSVILNPTFLEDVNFGFPGKIEAYEVAQAPAGYGAELIPGTNLTNWKLKVTTTANTELAAGAYPGAITGDFFLLYFVGAKATI